MSVCFPHTGIITQRRGGVRNSDGEYIQATPVQFNIKMSFQPLRGIERNNLPEGQRKSDINKVYFQKPGDLSPLQIGSNSAIADTLTFNGIVYLFLQTLDWDICTTFMKAIVIRQNNQDDA